MKILSGFSLLSVESVWFEGAWCWAALGVESANAGGNSHVLVIKEPSLARFYDEALAAAGEISPVVVRQSVTPFEGVEIPSGITDIVLASSSRSVLAALNAEGEMIEYIPTVPGVTHVEDRFSTPAATLPRQHVFTVGETAGLFAPTAAYLPVRCPAGHTGVPTNVRRAGSKFVGKCHSQAVDVDEALGVVHLGECAEPVEVITRMDSMRWATRERLLAVFAGWREQYLRSTRSRRVVAALELIA